jgi:hypothetical protein
MIVSTQIISGFIFTTLCVAVHASGVIRGPLIKNRNFIPKSSHQALAAYYNNNATGSNLPQIYLALDRAAPLNARFLSPAANYHRYVIRTGRRFTSTSSDEDTTTRSSSLVKACVKEEWKYGQIVSLFEHSQPTRDPTLFAEVTWFETLDTAPIQEDVWADL